MPELPEVERARKLIKHACKGYLIRKMHTVEDKLVYSGIAHTDYASELTGRTITGCERKGKLFWLTLTGPGRLPVMHFGMNGMIQLKGETPNWYVRRPKERKNVWPPKYHKFIMELEPQAGSVSDQPRELAFTDSRRFGRLKLVSQPVHLQPPVSKLGFDPMLSYPTIEEFRELLRKKKGTVKGVLMDQSFSAGVGNWVADEILYNARIHPACPVPALSDDDVVALHRQIREIPEQAVEVNAEHKRFPEDWLFRWRWKKGAKQARGAKKAAEIDSEEEALADLKPKNKAYLSLPDGKPATLDFIEVSGRTTALVREVQKLPEGVEIKPKVGRGKGKGKQEDEIHGAQSSNTSALTPLASPESDTPRDAINTENLAVGEASLNGSRAKNKRTARQPSTQGGEGGPPQTKLRRGTATRRTANDLNQGDSKEEPESRK